MNITPNKAAMDGYNWNGVWRGVLPLELLQVDPEYQRVLDHKRVAENIKKVNFVPLALERSLFVSKRRDDSYWVLDGLHRRGMAEELKWEWISVEVVEGLTRKQEANLFVVLNNVGKVTRIQKFRAYYLAGRDTQLQIVQIMKEFGFDYKAVPGRPKYGQNVLSMVDTLERIHENWDRRILRETLRIIKTVFPANADGIVQEHAKQRMMILGVASYLFHLHGDADDCIEVLTGHKAKDLLDEVKRMNRTAPTHQWKKMAKHIANMVEAHLEPKKKG